MAAGDLAGDRTPELLRLIHDITGICTVSSDASFRKDCTDLVRRISLLTHLFDEVKDLSSDSSCSGAGSASAVASWSSDLVVALHSAKRLLSVARNFRSNCSSVSVLILHACCFHASEVQQNLTHLHNWM